METRGSVGAWQGMDFLPVGICIIDPEFRVCYWNACLEEWTGIPTDEIRGEEITVRFPSLKRPVITERINQVLQGGAPIVFSSQIHHYLIPSCLPDGKMRIQRTTLIPVASEEEGRSNVMIVCEDVSTLTREVVAYRATKNNLTHELEERIKAEKELKAAQEALLAYLIESASRVMHPAETVRADLEGIIGDLDTGDWRPEEIRMQLQVEIGTIGAIEENLAELIKAATGGRRDIPEIFRKFLLEKGYES
ncbi:PAS domain-containing protein [Methanofollis ethanolicus]|uniref:PAS domain-containing protein n=1 Tax=Methanofollis ethanolicus TaxID=488124 RepID=UPI000833FCE0|nr:PAS domain-containing protein [Methanofollis ethanolicus]